MQGEEMTAKKVFFLPRVVITWQDDQWTGCFGINIDARERSDCRESTLPSKKCIMWQASRGHGVSGQTTVVEGQDKHRAGGYGEGRAERGGESGRRED